MFLSLVQNHCKIILLIECIKTLFILNVFSLCDAPAGTKSGKLGSRHILCNNKIFKTN